MERKGVNTKTTDYIGGMRYENDILKSIAHEEGRIVLTGEANIVQAIDDYPFSLEEKTYTRTAADPTHTQKKA